MKLNGYESCVIHLLIADVLSNSISLESKCYWNGIDNYYLIIDNVNDEDSDFNNYSFSEMLICNNFLNKIFSYDIDLHIINLFKLGSKDEQLNYLKEYILDTYKIDFKKCSELLIWSGSTNVKETTLKLLKNIINMENV